MPTKLSPTIGHITTSVPNHVNSSLINNFYTYMKSSEGSDRHQNNNLKAIIVFARFIGPNVSLYDIGKKEQVISFLDTKIKTERQDPDKKWITT
jgi:integrase/recombinase XerD